MLTKYNISNAIILEGGIMFYPLQIPNILDNEFKDKLNYQEYIPPHLKEYIMCIWSMRSEEYLKTPVNNVILPDGCIDIVINFSADIVIFSATSKATTYMPITGDIDYMGIRFRPGVFFLLFGIDAHEMMDQRITYEQIENYPLKNILELKNHEERVHFLIKYLEQKIKGIEIDIFTKFVNSNVSISDIKYVYELSKQLGYSEKQANRIFLKRCGYSIKTFLNIIRLHKALEALIYHEIDLLDIAIASGFYDQAHFIKNIEKYCGVSPTKLIASYQKMF